MRLPCAPAGAVATFKASSPLPSPSVGKGLRAARLRLEFSQMTTAATLADLAEFPFVESLPKREKSRVGKLLDVIGEIEQAQRERGPLLPQHVIADVLGVSRARVGQLVDGGRLESVRIGQTRFVFLASFREFAKQERPTGRPRKARLVEAARRGLCLGLAINDAIDGEEEKS